MTQWEYWTLEARWEKRGAEPGVFGRDRREHDWVASVGTSVIWGLKPILDHWGNVGWALAGIIPVGSGSQGAIGDSVLVPLHPGPPRAITLVLKRVRS